MRCEQRGPTGRVIHEGPFELSAAITEWTRRMSALTGHAAGLYAVIHCCAECGSHTEIHPDDLAAAERRAA
jgi:hypothetical protein